MMFDVAEEVRKEILLLAFKKDIHPKPTDIGLWKKGQVHESRGITYTIYRCPMSGRAGCRCMLRLVVAKDYLELQRSELRHHAASHAQDDSKKLKYEQMVAIRDAVVTAPQLSAAMLRRNMQMHGSPTKTISAEHLRSFQHQVYRVRKQLCAQQLKGFNLDDSYGKAARLCRLPPVVDAGAQAQRSLRWLPHWPPRLLRNRPPEGGCIRRLAYEHVIFLHAHSCLPRHQSRLGVSAQRGCRRQAALTSSHSRSLRFPNAKILCACILFRARRRARGRLRLFITNCAKRCVLCPASSPVTTRIVFHAESSLHC